MINNPCAIKKQNGCHFDFKLSQPIISSPAGLYIQPILEPDTVITLIMDSPKYGHSIINLYTKNMTYSPGTIPTIHFEPPKEDNLYLYKEHIYAGTKCPHFRDSTMLQADWLQKCFNVQIECVFLDR